VPATAVIFNAQGTRSQSWGRNTLRFQEVVLGRDFGTSIESRLDCQGHEMM